MLYDASEFHLLTESLVKGLLLRSLSSIGLLHVILTFAIRSDVLSNNVHKV